MYSHPAHHTALVALTSRHDDIAVAACVTEIHATSGVPTDIQLVPAGRFRARDGRPHDIAEGWLLNAALAARVIERTNAMAGDLVIDYEHQTLRSDENGKPAPAAGWFKRLEWREGQGLYALGVQWTPAAKAAIEAGEYRYLSPVLRHDKRTGEVVSIEMAALTNYPAIPGQGDLQALAAKFAFSTQQPHQEDDSVKRELLIKKLGLQADASDEQIEHALAALTARAETNEQAIAALKAAAPDPAKFVTVEAFEALKTQLAEVTTTAASKEVDELVSVALSSGKLLAVQEEWARELGKKDLAALKTYLEKTPAIAALKGQQSGGRGPGDERSSELDDTALAVCKQMGIDPAEYKKTLTAEAL